MDKKYLFLICAISLLLLISACSRGLSQPTSAPRNPYIGGTKGIIFDFEKDAPPPEVTDGQNFPFKIILNVENKGEYAVKMEELRARLVGFNPGDFGTTDIDIGVGNYLRGGEIGGSGETLDQDLDKVKRTPEGDVISGGISFLNFPARAQFFQPREFPGNTEFNIKAEVCYKYQTKAVGRLCILKNLIDKKPNAVCDPNGAKQAYSSASPIQVTNFRENVVGKDQIVFSFDVVHSGSGTVYRDRRSAGDVGEIGPGICPRDNPSTRRAALDKVYVDVNPNIGGFVQSRFGLEGCNLEGPTNTGSGFIRLIGNKRTVTCTLNVPEQQRSTDYESIVEITLDFNYDESKSTKLLVKHLPKSR